MIRTYTNLLTHKTFEDRVAYLMLYGTVGKQTFGGLRHINQQFYTSYSWKSVREHVILRDNFCELGIPGMGIIGDIYVHHMNPITPEVLVHNFELALDPEFLITVSYKTHQHIHYGQKPPTPYVERKNNDTIFWEEIKL